MTNFAISLPYGSVVVSLERKKISLVTDKCHLRNMILVDPYIFRIGSHSLVIPNFMTKKDKNICPSSKTFRLPSLQKRTGFNSPFPFLLGDAESRR